MQNLYQGAQQGVQGIQTALQNPQRPFGVSLIAWAVGILGAIYLLLLLLDIAITNLFAGIASALSQASSPGSPNAFASLIPNLNQSTPSTLLALVYPSFMAAAYLGLAPWPLPHQAMGLLDTLGSQCVQHPDCLYHPHTGPQ
jgi:hypothetical protein